MTLEAGNRLGRYEIVSLLGKGGMGEVYRARDTRLGRDVAIKVLRAELSQDRTFKQRFEREAKTISQLQHPSVCTLHDVGSEGGVDFLVMELLEGETLADRLERGALAMPEVLELGAQITEAVEAAHSKGLVHRDLKPGNVILTLTGAKVLDFGLAKAVKSGSTAVDTEVATATQPLTGMDGVVGTVPYMAPELLRGKTADVRSDLWALGCTLYEMASGEPPFSGESQADLVGSIMNGQPEPLEARGSLAPGRLGAVVSRCLEKDPAARIGSAAELAQELRENRRELLDDADAGQTVRAWFRRPPVPLLLAVVLVMAAASVAVLYRRGASIRWALEEAIPAIENLAAEELYKEAYELATRAEEHLGDHPKLRELWREIAVELGVITDPPGARVLMREYGDPEAPWRLVGTSPLDGVRAPRSPSVWRFEKKGYLPVDRAFLGGRGDLWWGGAGEDGQRLTRIEMGPLRLRPEGSPSAGMVEVLGRSPPFLMLSGLGHTGPFEVPTFLLDRTEVTNAEFAEFVTAGGYRRPEYWRHEFVRGGEVLSFDEATSELVDQTGQPGPSTWYLGEYPEGSGDLPVAGVSWYEAAAYADFRGKRLPSLYHWSTASGLWTSDHITPLSNFGDRGPVAVASSGAMTESGAYDTAGNVREWSWNATDAAGLRRYTVGGAWSEPPYMFHQAQALSPFDRSPENGFRCMKCLELGCGSEALLAPIEPPSRDYTTEEPVGDDLFAAYRSFYSYDPTDLNASLESRDRSWSHGVVERAAFDTAYGERMSALLFLPLGVAEPYQVVVWFPGSNSLRERSSEMRAPPGPIDFLVRSGRAVVLPIFKSTWERGDGVVSDRPDTSRGYRDHMIQWYQDLARTVDYLATRADLDLDRMAYYGTSWGAAVAPIMLALEDRFRVAVLTVGGFWQQTPLPEADQINFAPRVDVPVLMLNGRYDSLFSVEKSQKPMFRLLGTPDSDKHHLLFASAHAIPRNDVIRETLAWLDGYLGPVARE